MIAQIWHSAENLRNCTLKGGFLPGITKVRGYIGGYLFRRSNGEDVEFDLVLGIAGGTSCFRRIILRTRDRARGALPAPVALRRVRGIIRKCSCALPRVCLLPMRKISVPSVSEFGSTVRIKGYFPRPQYQRLTWQSAKKSSHI